MLPEAITARGEVASFFVVLAVLVLAVRPVATITRLDRALVGDLYWTGLIAFVAAGHLAYVALSDLRSLADPFILIRIQGGIEPLAGAAALAATGAWIARRRPDARGRVAAALAAGLAVGTIAYDLSCVVRDACYGAPAPAPLGFPMAGLAEPRVATPLVEAAALLGILALLVAAWPRMRPAALAAWMVAAVTLGRAALTPLSVAGREAVDARTAVTLAIGMGALAIAAWWSWRSTGRSEPEAAMSAPDPGPAR